MILCLRAIYVVGVDCIEVSGQASNYRTIVSRRQIVKLVVHCVCSQIYVGVDGDGGNGRYGASL